MPPVFIVAIFLHENDIEVPGVCVWHKSEGTKNLVKAGKAKLRTCTAEARKICWEIDPKNVTDSSLDLTQIDENR